MTIPNDCTMGKVVYKHNMKSILPRGKNGGQICPDFWSFINNL